MDHTTLMDAMDVFSTDVMPKRTYDRWLICSKNCQIVSTCDRWYICVLLLIGIVLFSVDVMPNRTYDTWLICSKNS